MNEGQYCIGVDYGTDSVRSIIVNAANGKEVASAVFNYPRWKEGMYCDAAANQFRQHPLDYMEGLEYTIKACIAKGGAAVAKNIKAISIDTTGSTPVAVNEKGWPLALLPGFENDPDAMFVLWKDHSGIEEATAINEHAKNFNNNYLKYVGGIYSSEWFWSKLLHVFKKNEAVREACFSWVEHCDWMPFLLTGGTSVADMKRSVCTAGHKALWSPEWDGLPPEEFFSTLSPLLAGVRPRLYSQVYAANESAGSLCDEWAQKLGLSTDVIVGIGAMDAHMGAVGGQIEPYYLSKVMGTSTCDMLVVPSAEMNGVLVKGICGQVDGSIIPGMIGLEAGQSSFGDIYAWFRQLLLWPLLNLLPKTTESSNAAQEKMVEDIAAAIIPELDKQAALLPFDEESELAIDWFNGRRTPDVNPLVHGNINGLGLDSNAPRIYRALVEATCFGAKRITARFEEEGIPVKGLIGVGGIAKKSPFVMQMMADVMDMPIRIHHSEHTCALGAAMFAATVAGIYTKVEDAMAAMGNGFDKEYFPQPEKVALYNERYKKYIATGNFVEQLTMQ